MFEEEKKTSLSDLIDIKLLQEIQDTFAQITNMASITVDNKGPVTKPSNFSEFCTKYSRGTPEGFKKCNDCNIKWGTLSAVKGEPVIFSCHYGLVHFALPIMAAGDHVGTILGGQVFLTPPDENFFRGIAKQLGVDEEKYLESVRNVKIVSEENVKAGAKLLYLMANTISEISHKNFELKERTKREKLYRIITETIRSSLDIDETKKIIVNIIGKTLKSDRCYITEYDKKNDKLLPINAEYLSSSEINSYKSVDLNLELPAFVELIKKGEKIVVNNKEILVNSKDKDFDDERKTMEKYKINSVYAFPIYYSNELLGGFSVHYVDENHYITEDEVKLLETIANQIGIAIYQARLYKTIQTQAEREKVSRIIIEILGSSLDKNTIKSLFVKNLCEYFNADRVVLAEFDQELKIFLSLDMSSEYLVNPDENSFIGYDWANPEISDYIQPLLNNQEINIFDWNEYIKERDKSKGFISLFKYANIKSSYNMPIFYQDRIMGFFCIEFTREIRKLTEEDLGVIRNICKQAGIALYHAELYSNAQHSNFL